MTPQPETQLFLALLQVRRRRVVFLQVTKALWQSCRQEMAAAPVLVLAAGILLADPDFVTPEEAATAPDEAATEAPDEAATTGLVSLGVLD